MQELLIQSYTTFKSKSILFYKKPPELISEGIAATPDEIDS